ncbi:hypothetical protein MMC20_000626 [Loxospora ochrophaea]|nr:hypothetical protein [Loxospora ochrophaea]
MKFLSVIYLSLSLASLSSAGRPHRLRHDNFHKREQEAKRAVGDMVTATIDGQVVTWVNEYAGGAPAAATSAAAVAPAPASSVSSSPTAAMGSVTPTASSAASATASAAASSGTSSGGDSDTGGPGIVLVNKGSSSTSYSFFDNISNGDGTADPNFTSALKTVTLAAGETQFVSLDTSFKGRVQRGTQIPATWAEFQISASNDGQAHGDISLEQGCDGAATIESTTNDSNGGFSHDILNGAPAAAFQNKPDGTAALGTTVGNWMSGPLQPAIDWEQSQVSTSKVYVTGGTGVDDVSDASNRFTITFY